MIRKILLVDASGTVDGSVSRAATAKLIADMAPADMTIRDLAETPLPQVDQTWINARLVPAQERSENERASLALSDRLIAEIAAADTIVIGMPMYNFGMPAALKAWIDLIARPKVTFAYTENGPVGLLEGKRAIVAASSGGVPIGSDMDFATPHLQQVLRFIGIDDITVHVAKDVVAAAA
ncbi:FMN-dependent NADH-azoreductase [Yoonia sp. 2307UL14-13]|uniref:FMN-dependent NADH-azoreductase n=1 Tax=Yoonia sp. 2307UL14-13 TaxID=3126506 RepID=UPI00309F3655